MPHFKNPSHHPQRAHHRLAYFNAFIVAFINDQRRIPIGRVTAYDIGNDRRVILIIAKILDLVITLLGCSFSRIAINLAFSTSFCLL
jgi:hypothetical protein